MTSETPREAAKPQAGSFRQRVRNYFSKPTDRLVEKIEDVFAAERNRAQQRRDRLGRGSLEGKHYGLALSGGGIRSATFSLGVLQGMSRAPAPDVAANVDPLGAPASSLLARFDYLSTVSGGGYAGAFFCSLFLPFRLRTRAKNSPPPTDAEKHEAAPPAALDAYRVFQYEPPGRIRSTETYTGPNDHIGKGPLALLRESGRYLAPGGAGDLVYVIGLAIRNWFAVHYVLGTFLAAAFALLALLRSGLVNLWPAYAGFEDWLLGLVPCVTSAGPCLDPRSFWWSPFWVVPLLVLALWLAPAFMSFWLTHPSKHDDDTVKPDFLSKAAVAALALALASLGLALVSLAVFGGSLSLAGLGVRDSVRAILDLDVTGSIGGGVALIATWPPHIYVLAMGGFVALLGFVFHVCTAAGKPTIAAQRVSITRAGASALLALIAATVVAIADTLSQSLYYFWAVVPDRPITATLSPAAVIAAVVWIFRRLALLSDEKKTPSFLRKLPIGIIAGIAGMLLFFAIATLWGFLVQWIVWEGKIPDGVSLASDRRLILAAFCAGTVVILAFVSGRFSGFLNLSSLQSFYSARLTRAYLGASNGKRFEPPESPKDRKALSVAEPIEKDQLSRDDYYSEQSLAPLHIINVTVNQTIDPAERLVQRDRKGKPLAVLPSGFSIDRLHYNFRDDDEVTGSITSGERSQKLTIGQWIGTSGAAFTTGLGRSTSLGTSIALGLANVRLGTWWSSGHGQDESRRFAHLFKRVFKTQTFLFYELTAKFHGLRREWQYLSDGGHFENTGLYELLRAEREIEIIVACDNGCDPRYRFEDLATLIRTARIDHRTRIELDPKIAEPGKDAAGQEDGLWRVFGTPDEFRKAAGEAGELGDDERRRLADKCALLLNVYHTDAKTPGPHCRIVLLKPRLIASTPIDVHEYHASHPDFPQQSTMDQFFDEAQWESYRCLGSRVAQRVFADNGAALWQYLNDTQPAPHNATDRTT